MHKEINVFISHAGKDEGQIDKFKTLMTDKKGYHFKDSSIVESEPNNASSPDYIKSAYLIPSINWAGTVIVLIGKDTHKSDWVNWEIEYAMKLGKKVIGVYIYGENNSIRVARYEGRCISAKGKPWDLMDWGFDIISNCNYYKTAVQLKQEAAVVISLGGGFQIYNNQNPDGSVNAYPIAQAKETAEFCRKRQVYNHKKIPIGQVGVYYSEKARYKNSNMFNAAGSTNAMIGVLGCILDAQHTAEIFYEYQMHTMERFDAVVFPEWDRITAEEKQNLLGYAENGGNLIVIGAKASKLFEDVLPVEWIEYHEKQRIYLMQDGILGGFETNFYEADGVGVKCYRWLDETSVYCTSIVKVSYGKGTVTAMLFDLGSSYFDLRSFALRNLMDDTLCSLYQPMVRLNQKNIDITIQKDGEKRIINLININGEHADDQVSVYDFVPPVYHLMVKIDMQNKYKKITMPLHSENAVKFRMNGDYAEFEIDITDLHEILVLE